MPRESAASLAIPRPVVVRTPRLRVPDGLSPAVRAQFVRLVSAAPADHFMASDVDMVVTYAQTLVWLRQGGLSLDGYVTLARLQAALAAKLRLCPSARTRIETAGRRRAPSAISVAAAVDMGDADDDA
jgi:hypothetical protein